MRVFVYPTVIYSVTFPIEIETDDSVDKIRQQILEMSDEAFIETKMGPIIQGIDFIQAARLIDDDTYVKLDNLACELEE